MDIEFLLEKNGLKKTKQRIQVLNIISELDLDATIKNILEKTDIDKSTVYRTIDTLLKNDVIETSINHKNELYYQINEHKHYIKCIKCHEKKEINICPVDSIEYNGFKVISHKIEIDGICSKCDGKK